MKKVLNLAQPNNHHTYFGFGLDYQYRERYPFLGMEGLVSEFENQLSHLSIVSIPSLAEAKKLKTIANGQLPFIHHLSGIAPADPHGPDLQTLHLQEQISQELNALWCLEDIGIWSIGPYGLPYFIPVLFNSEIASLVAKRILKIKEQISIPFLAEIPSCSFVIGNQSLGDFFHQLVDESGCGIVLDVSHVFSYGLATDQESKKILRSIPLNAVTEIHIAGGKVNRTYPHRYIDSHSSPIMDEVYELLCEAVESCEKLRAVTYEIGVQSTDDLIKMEVERLNQVLVNLAFKPNLQHTL
jgi:uncharacterized protein (UPF0276 family)